MSTPSVKLDPESVIATPPDQDADYIKRVVGLPGDVVEVRGKAAYVDGTPQPIPAGRQQAWQVYKKDARMQLPAPRLHALGVTDVYATPDPALVVVHATDGFIHLVLSRVVWDVEFVRDPLGVPRRNHHDVDRGARFDFFAGCNRLPGDGARGTAVGLFIGDGSQFQPEILEGGTCFRFGQTDEAGNFDERRALVSRTFSIEGGDWNGAT